MGPAEWGECGPSVQISWLGKARNPVDTTYRRSKMQTVIFYRLQERQMSPRLPRGFPQIMQLGSRRELPEDTPVHNALGKQPNSQTILRPEAGLGERGSGPAVLLWGPGTQGKMRAAEAAFRRPARRSSWLGFPAHKSINQSQSRAAQGSAQRRRWGAELPYFLAGGHVLTKQPQLKSGMIACVIKRPRSALRCAAECSKSSEWWPSFAFTDNAPLLLCLVFVCWNQRTRKCLSGEEPAILHTQAPSLHRRGNHNPGRKNEVSETAPPTTDHAGPTLRGMTADESVPCSMTLQ